MSYVARTYFGKPIATMTDEELRSYALRAWNCCEGDELRGLRAEAARRGIVVQ